MVRFKPLDSQKKQPKLLISVISLSTKCYSTAHKLLIPVGGFPPRLYADINISLGERVEAVETE